MDRPSRIRKTVNYSDSMHSDDEDFATVRGPPNKKVRSFKEHHHEKNKGTRSNPAKDIVDMTDEQCTERISLDEKLYKRHMEAALSLSMLQRTSVSDLDVECPPPVLTDCNVGSSNHTPQDLPPVLSHCSVDVSCTEIDSHFSDPQESDDEEYTVTKKVKSEKMCRNEKKTIKKEKKTSKLLKAKSQSTASDTVLSPDVAQFVPSLKRTPKTPPTPKLALCSSPVGGRLPKWNPPGLIGSCPTSFQKAPVKSPGLGLRLGLSRMARLKPLHPNAVTN